MKQATIIILGFILTGCSNSRNENDLKKTYNEDLWEISVKASGNVQHRYQLMENFPTEGGPVITEEPEHAVLSEIKYGEGGIYYVYQPEAGFTGTDEVEITNNISNGAEIVAQTILKLTIEVKE